jgi:hypothetical protein
LKLKVCRLNQNGHKNDQGHSCVAEHGKPKP